MKTKEKVLSMLQENAGVYLSGQEIADAIFVTRACVWKAIKALREDGCEIDAITNKGYRMLQAKDIIDSAEVARYLAEKGIDIPVLYYEEVSSTNDECEKYARANHGDCLIIANSQTDGRGRRGRTFYSPKNTGLYFSLLVFPKKEMNRLTDFTAYAACATACSLDKVVYKGESRTRIKWVNDVFADDAKVAGILCEAHFSLEEEEQGHIIVGIGINVYTPENDFPREIKEIAGSVISSGNTEVVNGIRNVLTAEIVAGIYKYCQGDEGKKRECLNTYRDKSFLIGKYVRINSYGSEKKYAQVMGISEEYHLLVRYDDGKEEALFSGEVSAEKY